MAEAVDSPTLRVAVAATTVKQNGLGDDVPKPNLCLIPGVTLSNSGSTREHMASSCGLPSQSCAVRCRG